ncbi:hypothetical protein SETIT_2G240700v2 [Setaria italica]|uniref:Uncharacterized protein n=1 Tax=Setaria italica TaxID=4555 RepID=A0A368Q223_SETIT|nr:hypothetical protein SETIT_2G240700v2 [Setaria italica]
MEEASVSEAGDFDRGGKQLASASEPRRGKKKVVKKKLPEAHIDDVEERLYTIKDIPEDDLAKYYSQEFRDIYGAEKVIAHKIAAYQRALLAQYDALGFAEDETEVSDEEELTDDKDKVEAAN